MMDRRNFCLTAAAAAASAYTNAPAALALPHKSLISAREVARIDRERILRAANEYLPQPPITITASNSPRSHGGKHDYFSEGDYWWPDPTILTGLISAATATPPRATSTPIANPSPASACPAPLGSGHG